MREKYLKKIPVCVELNAYFSTMQILRKKFRADSPNFY